MTNEYNAVEQKHWNTMTEIIRPWSDGTQEFIDGEISPESLRLHASVTKEVSMSFAEWIAENHYWKSTDTRFALTVGLWTTNINGDFNPDDGLSTSALYDLYITKHLNK